jgi:hypothetical protein
MAGRGKQLGRQVRHVSRWAETSWLARRCIAELGLAGLRSIIILFYLLSRARRMFFVCFLSGIAREAWNCMGIGLDTCSKLIGALGPSYEPIGLCTMFAS